MRIGLSSGIGGGDGDTKGNSPTGAAGGVPSVPGASAAPSAAGAWRREGGEASLAESHRTIKVAGGGRFPRLRKFLAFAGPGFLVAVGYMDPGNWATDLAGGSRFGYTLLSVILVSNLMAILLQHLCVKLGIATGRDLAQACRDHYSTPTVWFLWTLCELAIAACDLAEVLGTAIALQLLFGIPLLWGCVITCADVLAVLWLQKRGFRLVEAVVLALMLTVTGCFAAELFMAKPSLAGVLAGLTPSSEILADAGMLYVGIGILGATVMPHNLYLHSSIVQTRDFAPTPAGKREAVRFATLDSTLALAFAFFINAAILVLAAAAFHGKQEVAEIDDGYKLLGSTLGPLAATLFAVALLASGQNSTITGTLAGQIVMEGFLRIRLRPWVRRLVTRGIAIVPAVLVIAIFGEGRANDLLIASQVILSFQLGFAVWPLLRFTGERAKMGEFTNPWWIKALGWTTAAVIIGLNVKLLWDEFARPLLNHLSNAL